MLDQSYKMSLQRSHFPPLPEKLDRPFSYRYNRQSRFSQHSRVSTKPFDDLQLRQSLGQYVRAHMLKMGRLLHFQRVYILAKGSAEMRGDSAKPGMAFNEEARNNFRKHLIEIIVPVNQSSVSKDIITGLCLFLGDYLLLLIEGAEDMIGDVLTQFMPHKSKFWVKDRIFYVDDKIGEAYFNNFVFRHSYPINLNDTFPPETADDEELMAEQHFLLKDKVQRMCQLLSEDMKKILSSVEHIPTPHVQSSLQSGSKVKHGKKFPFHHMHHSSALQQAQQHAQHQAQLQRNPLYQMEKYLAEKFTPDMTLQMDDYYRLLPEAQRMELVLTSTRFYRKFEDYYLIYGYIPTQLDDESQIWPPFNNYTPLGIFERQPHDFNLTFSRYADGTEDFDGFSEDSDEKKDQKDDDEDDDTSERKEAKEGGEPREGEQRRGDGDQKDGGETKEGRDQRDGEGEHKFDGDDRKEAEAKREAEEKMMEEAKMEAERKEIAAGKPQQRNTIEQVDFEEESYEESDNDYDAETSN